VTAPVAPGESCANCGRGFRGRFCPDCGQEIQEVRRPIGQLVGEFLGDFLAFDARIWRTLVPLVAKPGELTREYFAGRRARYVPPFRLYVFGGFLYFTVMALTGGGPFAPVITSQDGVTAVSLRGIRLQSGIVTEDASGDGRPATREEASEETIFRRFDDQAVAATRDQRAFARSLIGSLSYAHFLLMPIFAMLLKAFYRKRYVAEHLIFSLHYHAFVLLPGAMVVGVSTLLGADAVGRGGRAVSSAWLLALAAYLFVAMRRVYGESRRRTALKLLGLGFAYSAVAAVVIILVAIGTIWFY
jgi:hypothetical protein